MSWLSNLLGIKSAQPGLGRRPIGREWHKVGSDFVAIRHGKEPSYDLVGESHWQENIAATVGERYVEGVYWQVVGQLCFEDNNPADKNAVVVLIDSRPVGWLTRSDCKKVRAQILSQNPDAKPVICKAMIHGGFQARDGTWASYGVRIGLSDPIELFECEAPE